MKPVAHLDMKFCLPLIRKAFDDEKLQMFRQDQMSCDYSGPCAIGVCLTTELQEALDNTNNYPKTCGDSDIGTYFEIGVVTCPPQQREDFIQLQSLHDKAIIGDNKGIDIEEFGKFLIRLEKKYGK